MLFQTPTKNTFAPIQTYYSPKGVADLSSLPNEGSFAETVLGSSDCGDNDNLVEEELLLGEAPTPTLLDQIATLKAKHQALPPAKPVNSQIRVVRPLTPVIDDETTAEKNNINVQCNQLLAQVSLELQRLQELAKKEAKAHKKNPIWGLFSYCFFLSAAEKAKKLESQKKLFQTNKDGSSLAGLKSILATKRGFFKGATSYSVDIQMKINALQRKDQFKEPTAPVAKSRSYFSF